jgi:hypothetical protein
MNISELKSALGIENDKLKNNTIAIDRNSLTDNINDIVNYCYGNTPIVINNAQFIKEDSTTNSVFLKGTSNFLGITDLEVNAQFSVDKSNLVQVFFKYTVLDNNPGPNKWTFSRSFPQLPAIIDNTKPVIYNRVERTFDQPTIIALDQLFLFNSYFVVVSNPQIEPEFQVNLDWGINFVGNLRPSGFIGVVENLFQHKNKLTIYGSIRQPLPTETPNNLAQKYPVSPEKFQFPWSVADDFPKGIPGILLKVKLDLSYGVTDTIEFRVDNLIIYSPVNSDWILYNTNPGFFPMQAYTGSILLNEAGLSIDMVSPIDYGIDEFQLIGIFKGFILQDLAYLAGLTGSSDSPLSLLPDEIKTRGSSLGKLELMSASISIDYSDVKSISVSNASFTVGMPELNWNVWKDDSGNKTYFEVDSIACSFNFDYPFSVSKEEIDERKVGVMVYGNIKIEDVPFTVYAGYDDGFALYGEMTQGQTIALNKILTTYAPGIPAPGDLTINVFKVAIFPGQFYSMALTLASEPTPWIIPLGPKDSIVEDISMGFTYNQGGSATGTVSGIIKLTDGIQLNISYDTPGNIAIRSFLPIISLNQILDTFTNQTLDIPDAFHLNFINNSVLIQKQADNYVFQMATDMEELGLVALQVQKITSVWGIAFGIDMIDVKPSSLSGLGFLDAFEKMFQMQKFMLVVSSFDGVQFQFPDMASFNNPALPTRNISLPAQATTLVAGLNIYANWTIDTSDKQQKLLQQFLGTSPTLGVTLQVSKNPEQFSKLFVSYKTTIQGLPFSCQFGGQIRDGQVGLFLTGTLQAEIQKQLIRFDATLLFVANGAFVSGSMLGSVTFEGLTLSNLALVVGVDWEGIPSLGMAATLDVTDFNSAVALFFDSTDPARSMFAGAVSDLTLLSVVQTIAGQSSAPAGLGDVLGKIGLKGLKAFALPATVATALDNRDLPAIAAAFQQYGSTLIPSQSDGVLLEINTQGSVWHLTDMTTMLHYSLSCQGDQITVDLQPQIYCAPQDTFIGAIKFPQAFYVAAEIDYLLLQAQIRVLVNPRIGITADVDVTPIIIYSPTFFAVTAADGKGGPRLSLATFSQPNLPDANLRGPHFLVNGKLELLGIDVSSMYISISSSGFDFAIKQQVNPALSLDVTGNFDSLNNLHAGGKAVVGLDRGLDLGPLGHVNVQTDVNGSIDIGYKGGKAYATFQGGFDFQGVHGAIPTLTLNVDGPALANLADTVWEQVKDIINKALKDADQWLNWVKSGVIQGAGQTAQAVGQVLHQVYNLPNNEIAGKTKQILDYSIDGITEALNGAGATADQAVQSLAGLGYQAADISKAIAGVFKNIHVDTSFGHVDTNGPHVDTPQVHADIPRTHVDTSQHIDLGGDHIDKGSSWHHIDTGTPHADSRPHVDQTTTPHADTNTPHADTTPHVDTGTHVDVKP